MLSMDHIPGPTSVKMRELRETTDGLEELRKMVGDLHQTIKALKKQSDSVVNTKLGIKKGIETAYSQIEEMARKCASSIPKMIEMTKAKVQDANMKGTIQVAQRTCATQCDPVKPQKSKVETKNAVTQTQDESCRQQEEDINKKITELKEEQTTEEYIAKATELIRKKWPKETYRVSKLKGGGLIHTAKGKDMAIIMDSEIEGKHPLVTKLSETQPQLEGVIEKRLVKPGKLIYTTSSNTIIDDEGTAETDKRLTYLAGIDGRKSQDDNLAHLLSIMKSIKTIAKRENRRHIIFTCTTAGYVEHVRKVIEIILRDEDLTNELLSKEANHSKRDQARMSTNRGTGMAKTNAEGLEQTKKGNNGSQTMSRGPNIRQHS